jgi:hypothetical protein
MTRPERVRDDGTETERETKKRRNSLGEELEVDPPLCDPPEMRGVGGNLPPHHDRLLHLVLGLYLFLLRMSAYDSSVT